MKLTAMLCDFAQVSPDGKLTVVGAGWNLTGPAPTPTAVALLFHVPWDQANTAIKFRVQLLDADEVQVTQPGTLGEVPVQAEGQLEVGRPAGVKRGSELNVPFAFLVPPLALQPDTRYQWVITAEGSTMDPVRLPFQTRAVQ